MADPQLDLASLVSRLEQLEARQNVVSKYMVGLKRQFDGMSEGLQQIEHLKGQISELQQRFNQLPTLRNGLDNVQTPNGAAESVNVDEAETGKPLVERVEQQQCEEAAPTVISQSSESVVDTPEVGVNADAAETEKDKEIDVVAQQEESPTAFSDEDFKTERMIWLLNRIYAAEARNQETPIEAEEFLKRFNENERDFTEINLAGANLSGKSLIYQLNLSRANLRGANLSQAYLSGANLSEANLDNADLRGANLSGGVKLGKAKLRKANISGACLHSADLSEANLSGANLVKADLSQKTNLSGANLSDANLSGVNLSWQANLSGTNLSGANLSGAYLRTANLSGANLSNANLSNANLLEANLEGANLQGANLQQALYNAATILPPGFDPAKAGAYLIAPEVSLIKANLAGADLTQVNLTGANL
jgi:uncharacterized protein YjbI with pentapeptide repeats